MSQKLPVYDFEWVEELSKFDVEYLKILFHLHKEFTF